MTGLLWLPAATRDDHGQRLGWTQTVNPKGVIHTTEGAGWPNYNGWTVDPHATVMPRPGIGVEIRQHVPFDHASFALVHNAAQPTNTDYAFQFELIGTSERGGPGYFWPSADDAVLRDFYRKVIEPLIAGRGLPARSTVRWESYPASYGANNGVRLGAHAWDVYTGWLGHEHVVENLHGDPGLFPWARMLELVKTGPPVKPPVKPPVPPVVPPVKPITKDHEMTYARATHDSTDGTLKAGTVMALGLSSTGKVRTKLTPALWFGADRKPNPADQVTGILGVVKDANVARMTGDELQGWGTEV